MIKVKYEKYRNDYDRMIEEKWFHNLQEVQDWLFDICEGEYAKGMFFINPASTIPYFKGKLNLDSSCISVNGRSYDTWVLQINKDGKIIYSTGRFTNGISYWNDEVKQWIMACRERQLKNPTFNFG